MSNKNRQGQIDVSIVPHPFAVERVRHRVAAGQSVAAILAQLQPEGVLTPHAHIYLNGDYVARQMWARLYPKAGTILSIRLVPMGGGGGGGKNPLRTILSLAVMAAAPQLAAGMTGLFGTSAFMGISVGKLVTTGVNLLGRLALNALAPPAHARFGGGQKESPTLFIQGARNQATPFARVPKVLGRHRFVPPLGALPYTETVGNEQYLRMLFVWGYGPLHISDLKIGETPLSDFTDVQIETREGYATDAPITLYSNSVIQNDLQVNLKAVTGYAIRTTEAEADEISVDITLPRGLFNFDAGNSKTAASVQLEIQYSLKDQNNWSAGAGSYKAVAAQSIGGITKPAAYVYNGVSYMAARIDRLVMDITSGAVRRIQGVNFRMGIDAGTVQPPAIPSGLLPIAAVERQSGDADIIPSGRIRDERDLSLVGVNYQAVGNFLVTASATAHGIDIAAGGVQFAAINVTAKQSAALRKSVSFSVPKGQYDVRVRRITADAVSDTVFDETVWTALRTVRYSQPVKMQGIAMTALRIKATDQMNGMIERFNGVVHSIVPDWNGTAWVEQVTSNPAALFRHALQGSANARPLVDGRLDIARLEEWHDSCAAEGREFNAVIDYDVSVREILQGIAAAGRASPTVLDGKWAVVEDKPQSVPVQHFTPRNSFKFQGEKSFEDIPQALRVRFINRAKGWLQDELLVFDDGVDENTVTKYETLELNGITGAVQAWREGRYHMATARLRPETYSFYADIEHIVCTRGDLIRFTHDVPMFGLMSARVKAVAAAGGVFTAVTLDADVTMEANKSYSLRLRKSDGSSLVKAVATVAGTTATLTFVMPYNLSDGEIVGTLALFGETGMESVALIVKSIEPQNDLNAKLTCVDAAPAVHTVDTAAMPVFSSVVGSAPEMQRPPAPVVGQIQSGTETLIRHADGSVTSRILITLKPYTFNRGLTLEARIRDTDESDFHSAEVIFQSADKLSITDVKEGESYDIQLRYRSDTGSLSLPLLIVGHRVEGTTALPSDVTGFNMNVFGNTAYLSWNAVTDIDLSYYTLRFTPQITAVTWGSASDIVSRIAMDATSISIPVTAGTYLLKAVDVGGRQSATPALVVSNMTGLAGFNAIETLTEDSSFSGNKSGLGVSDAALRLGGADLVEDEASFDDIVNMDVSVHGLVAQGIYDFGQAVDLGAVYISRLTLDMHVIGMDDTSLLDNWTAVDQQESFEQAVDPSLWGVQQQLRTTNDDPAATPVWSDWANFVTGDCSARAYQFRTILSNQSPFVTPSVTRLRVGIDMPDRTAGGSSITSLAAGSAVLFDKKFHATPVLSITPRNLATGDYYTITGASAAGFTIQFLNAAGTGVSRVFDYLVKGYGEES